MADNGTLTITQQLAGFQVGVPKNITAQHMRDTALSIDNKINADAGGDLKADGTVPLTDNWNVGVFKITANQFQSDVAIGTAPFVVTSTTTVSNLSADTVDGIEGALIIQSGGGVPLTGNWDTGAFNILLQDLQARSGQVMSIRDLNGIQILRIGSLSLRVPDNIPLQFGTGADASIEFNTVQTNDHMVITVDSVTNVLLITDEDRANTNFAIGAQAVPTLFIHDGSVTTTNRTALSQSGSIFRIDSNGSIRLKVAATDIMRIAAGTFITQIAGADPTNNTTGLDSRKLGFETRLWDGAAQTRTGFLRFEDVSGEDDQGQFTFSSNDNGGSETDFIEIRHDTSAFIKASTGKSLILEDAGGVDRFTLTSTGTMQINGTMRVNTDQTLSIGSSSNVQFQYDSAQTNDGLLIGTEGAAGNYILITHKARINTDLGAGAQTNPTLYIHDGSATGVNRMRFAHTGTVAILHTEAGAMELRSPDNADKFALNNTGLSFYGAAPAAKPTVSGSRADTEAALADLLTELATLGLLTDSSTA